MKSNDYMTVAQKSVEIMKEKIGNIMPNGFSLSNTLEEQFGTNSEALESIRVMQESLCNIGAVLSDCLQEIQDSRLIVDDDEIWKQRKKSLESWGKYGWTIYPNDNVEWYYEAPVSRFVADEKMSKCLLKENIDVLFENIIGFDTCNISLFKECIDVYNMNSYTCCAMLLCVLIEFELRRFLCKEMDVSLDSADKIKVSELFNANIKNRKLTNKEYTIECISMIKKCVNIFYGEINDENLHKAGVFNRNVVMHGLKQLSVSKKECVQLFLLYRNVLNLSKVLENWYEK